ncbi:MAG: class D sortase [Patescibacteria group bacterium]|nr:class D sortase [Patescibacteria group bacterium]
MREEKNKLKNNKKYIARVITGILVFVVFVVSIGLIDNYYSSHYKKPTIKKPTVYIGETSDIGVVKQFELSIPKIGVRVNVVPNVDGNSDKTYNQALKLGVAHYKNTALPASGSNILIFGHSSGVWGAGPYSTVFAKLNNLAVKDEILINYNNKNYKYSVSEKKIIQASDISITEPTEKEQLTLMTCWPVGTDKERLVVIAKPYK